MREEWPTAPPEPTDLDQTTVTNQLPVRKCIYCDDPIEAGDGYLDHITSCDASEETVTIDYPNGFFGIVIPEQSGYVWRTKTGGFACRNVAIQGTLIPLGKIRTLELDAEEPDLDGKFDSFDDPEEARTLYLRGLRVSSDYEYGGINLGSKLVNERLAGVYTDDEEESERLLETRADRLNAVWDTINDELPFEYERVVAPVGRPVTQEGLRWMNVTARDDDSLYGGPWVDALVERDEPVALYYPNSD